MIKRWCLYLSALALCVGFYVAMPVWAAWIAVLTVAGSPLVSVAVRMIMPKRGGEYDCLGLFRFSAERVRGLEYVQQLRPYRPGDSLGRVHWKLTAKTGKITVWEERLQQNGIAVQPAVRGILAMVPVGICLLLLLLAFPKNRYEQQLRMLQELFIFSGDDTVLLDLTAGPRSENKQAVLDVVASEGQLLYLRGQSFETYDGSSWQAADRAAQWQPQGAIGRVSIATRQGEEYTISQLPEAETPKDCLQLPEDTRLWAEGILAECGESVAQIQCFARNCASYDENVEAMPAGVDFARWFLEESGRGYCVHFATLTVVILRAAGTPARLATGYTVMVQAGVRKTVTGQDAHAWAEYWDGSAWQILEATPTVEAAPPAETPVLPPRGETESRLLSGWWVLILVALAVQELGLRKIGKLPEHLRLKELKQKAVFSRNGLTEEEKEELYTLSREKILHTFSFQRNTREEREGKKMKQEEKKPISWEVADPKPPVVQSGKMENRKQN